MIIVFLGPPGSGKGTQAQELSKVKKWPQLSTGDMLRAAIASGSDLGKKAKSIMDKGNLVTDDIVVGLIRERTLEKDCKNGFILDGFPRTIPQAKALDEMLAERKSGIDLIVLFDIADELLVSRLSGRRTCTQCGAMYHMETLKPKKAGICDKCGSKLIQRADDEEATIKNRLKVYQELTQPLANYYQKQKKLKRIDAALSPQKVGQALHALL